MKVVSIFIFVDLIIWQGQWLKKKIYIYIIIYTIIYSFSEAISYFAHSFLASFTHRILHCHFSTCPYACGGLIRDRHCNHRRQSAPEERSAAEKRVQRLCKLLRSLGNLLHSAAAKLAQIWTQRWGHQGT